MTIRRSTTGAAPQRPATGTPPCEPAPDPAPSTSAPGGAARSGVPAFLGITFGLTWAGVLCAELLGASMANPLVQLSIAFMPALAAVVVRRWITREGFGDAALALRVRAARRYYVLALVGPVLVAVAVIALAGALGLHRPDPAALTATLSDATVPAPVVVAGWLLSPVLTMPIFLGEEFGWRGYLQPRVSRHALRAAIITGLIWAVWHYPLAFTDYVDYANPLVGIATWTLLAVLLAIILAWLYARSRTIWVPCLAHAGNNLVVGTLSGILLIDGGGLDPTSADLLTAVPLAVICAWIVLSGQLSPSSGDARRGVRS